MEEKRFKNRRDAGMQLARHLKEYRERPDVLVLALPRGGVPVGFEVAHALDAPLDVFVVRKLGVPGHEELAMGAVASGGVRVLNEEILAALDIEEETLARVAAEEERELARRERTYRGERSMPEIRDHTIILVDDGLATGSTMKAAATALRSEDPKRIVAAVPVAAAEACDALRAEVDEIICVLTPQPFFAIGLWYEEFVQTTDEEVRRLLAEARSPA